MAAALTSAVKVRLEPELRAGLERVAEAAGVPASAIVRNLVREHVARVEAELAEHADD